MIFIEAVMVSASVDRAIPVFCGGHVFSMIPAVHYQNPTCGWGAAGEFQPRILTDLHGWN